MAVGISVIVDDDLIKKMETADGLIKKLADDSEATRDRMIAAFKSMGDNGVQYLINKLKDAQTSLNELSAKEIKIKTTGLDEVATQATQAVDNVNNLLQVMQKVSETKQVGGVSVMNIAELKESIRSISEAINDTENLLDKNTQQYLVNARDALKQELKLQEESTRQKTEKAEKETQKRIELNIRETAEFEKMTTSEQQTYLKMLDKMAQERMAYQERMTQVTNTKNKIESNIEASVNEEIKKENEAYMRMLETQTKAEQEYQARMSELKARRAKVEADAQKAVDEEIKRENDAYQKELENRIKAEQEYQARMVLLKEKRAKIESDVQKSVEDEIKKETESYQKELEKRIKTEQEYQARMTQIRMAQQQRQRETYSGALAYSSQATTLTEEKQAIDYLNQAKQNLIKTDSDYSKKLNELNTAIRKHQENIKRAGMTDSEYADMVKKNAEQRRNAAIRETEAYERRKKVVMDKWYSSSPDRALNFSSTTKSINEQTQAIKYLQAARDNLSKKNMTDEQYKKKVQQLTDEIKRQQGEIAKLIGKNSQLAKSHSKLMDMSGQLARKLALVFSISQIQGYINHLVKIRGEFELQQKSLQVLLQNRDEANKLWQQTVELAVKSPFRVGELVSYTRQLAAYRIETSKLHETTRKLADVSAGLGVDMNRLILAYGQVRAAEYLRGTELRQFTEAGIPMLDELAKRFSALEGRMITAGDVFERISKRMVSFKDVAAVFDTMTSAGGTFYRMQEQQSETLKGQMSNLKDAIDLMLNDIGKTNESVLKGGVKLARGFVDNWKEIAFIVEKIVYSLAAHKLATLAYNAGVKNAATSTLWWNTALKTKIGTAMADIQTLSWQEAKILGVSRAQYMAGKATLYFQGAVRGLGIALKTIAPLVIVGIILELWRRMTEASRAAEELQKNLRNLVNEDYSNVEVLADNYKSLVTQLRNANEGSKERREIIAKLNSQYGEYLDMVIDEKTNVNELATAYDDVLKRMKEKAALSTMEKGLNTIAESYGKKLDDAEEKFRNLFKGASIKKIGDDFGFIIPNEDDIDNIMSILQTKTRELNAEQMDSLQEQQDIIQSIIKEYYGNDFYLGRDYNESIKLIDILVEKKKEEEKLEKRINTQYKETLKSREANLALEKLQNEYKQKQININKKANLTDFEAQKQLEKAKEKYELDKINIKLQFGEISEIEAQRAKDRILNWATQTVKDVNEKLRLDKELFGYTEEQMATILISQEEQAQGMATIIKHTIDGWNTANEIIAEQISLKSAGLSIDEQTLKKYQDQEVLYRQRAKALGVELKYVTKINEATWKSINAKLPNDYMLTLEDSYKSINTLMDEYTKKENESVTLLKRIYEQKKLGLDVDNEQVKQLKEQIEQYREIRKMLGEVIEPSIDTESRNAINALLPIDYQIGFIDSMKSVTELQEEANRAKEQAIKLDETYQNQIKQGIPVEKELINKAKEDIEWYTKKWRYLGGIEDEKKKGKGRANSLYDERIKVIDDMNKKYKELNKTLSKSESLQGAFDAYVDAFATAFDEISWIPKNVRQMTVEEFATQVLNFPNEDALVAFLDKLSKEPMKTFEKIKVELAKGKYVYDMKVNAKVANDKELTSKIEDLFSGYELSIELDKMNIPADMAKDLFDIDATSLDELKAKLQELSSDFIGTDMEEQYQKYLSKVAEMEEKARIERLKTYTAYLVAAQSEAVKIKLEEARKIAEIEDMTEMSIAQKQMAKQAVREETQKKLDKQQWEDFKNTDMYIELFEELDNVSTKTLENMKAKLVKMRKSLNNLDPSQLKDIAKRIEDVNNALISKNPFKGLIKNIRNVVKSYKDYQVYANKALNSQQAVDNQKEIVDNLQLQVEAQKKVVYENENSSDASNLNLAIEKTYLYQLEKELAKQKEILQNKTEQNNQAQEEKENAKDILGITNEQLSKSAQQLNEGYAAFTDLTDSFQTMFGSFDESTQDFLDDIGFIVNGITQVENGLSQILNAKPITGSLNILSGMLKSIGGIFGLGTKDNKKERQIQREIDKVEDLQHAYEKLEKAINDAYAIDTLELTTKNAKANLQKQIDGYNSMIAAEEAKKKTDKDRIKEWQYAIEDLQEQIKELDKQSFSKATNGIVDDVLSAANEFTDAWLSAFNEVGNGLSGLKDNFQEMMLNMVKQQASMLITQQYVNNWKKELERYISADDLELTTDEAKQWVASVTNSLPQLNDALTAYFEAMKGAGIDLTGGNSNLSGLARSIQGITDEQADILAAYANSCRFLLANIDTTLTSFANQILGGKNMPNPILSELRAQTELVRGISTLLNSLTSGGHSMGGRGFRVFIS